MLEGSGREPGRLKVRLKFVGTSIRDTEYNQQWIIELLPHRWRAETGHESYGEYFSIIQKGKFRRSWLCSCFRKRLEETNTSRGLAD